jgi:hypothetical protein
MRELEGVSLQIEGDTLVTVNNGAIENFKTFVRNVYLTDK